MPDFIRGGGRSMTEQEIYMARALALAEEAAAAGEVTLR